MRVGVVNPVGRKAGHFGEVNLRPSTVRGARYSSTGEDMNRDSSKSALGGIGENGLGRDSDLQIRESCSQADDHRTPLIHRQRSQISHDLPSLGIWQTRPRGHTVS
jgi:hypothetical protein